MLPNLHYFNPGHETAILHKSGNFTPSINVRKMAVDLAFLPAWYANAGDFIWINDTKNSFSVFPELPAEISPEVFVLSENSLLHQTVSSTCMYANPWGLSPHSLSLFDKIRQAGIHLSIPKWNEDFFSLTSRQTASIIYEIIKESLPDLTFSSTPYFTDNVSSLKKYLEVYNNTIRFILKTPYSSSGRGLLWINNSLSEKEVSWIQGVLKKQGAISIEKALNKIQDFALEFYSDGKGNITYEGISVFQTSEKGSYEGNILANEDYLVSLITNKTGKIYFERIKGAVIKALKRIYGTIYKGYLGVDMMIYQTDQQYHIHPCIEINMRHTMGLLCSFLFKNYILPDSRGKFTVQYKKNKGESFRIHEENLNKYPLQIIGNRIKSGYLSLCPITEDTNYVASVWINSACNL